MEYSCCSFSNDLTTLAFYEILLSIVSTSNGSAAAKTIPSISFSMEESFDGKFITLLSFFNYFLIIYSP